MERETVVRAAIELLDEVGLDGLSLRRLATRLGIQAPTLYWYFKSKQELLDQMAIAVMEPPETREAPDPGAPWDEWLSWMARGMRAAVLAHRDGALLAARARPTEQQWDALEFIVSALVASGFSADDAMRGIGALTNYVLGTALEEQQAGADEAAVAGRIDPARWPTLAAAVTRDTDHEQRFEHGLRMLLAGMRATRTSEAPARS
ncbi:TetR/AcrR family transcriptional regulator C-terminal domain-containing protein [Micromonospora auratinigra]|uniref:Transcriptional regulator, TetR family n=1 Tax=Micromonospora auratinigra TaxID=261654 RepID=A0A1A8ZG46_9ACTN|nr:TetR/AcrR family transcriptional regulator C-terminal domain-containing protein [Micromonospora auratinigra]SBT42814.1 transcriptional regulator, TetR family [Micromonospora auratinigra]